MFPKNYLELRAYLKLILKVRYVEIGCLIFENYWKNILGIDVENSFSYWYGVKLIYKFWNFNVDSNYIFFTNVPNLNIIPLSTASSLSFKITPTFPINVWKIFPLLYFSVLKFSKRPNSKNTEKLSKIQIPS